MKTLALTKNSIEECAARGADVLRKGGVLLYPTDTLYGLGADALSTEAVAKIYAIKNRDLRKPIHCIVADLAMAYRYGIIGDEARQLAKAFWPGPLTLVVPKKAGVHSGIAKDIDTIGIRIPNDEFCLALARKFGRPFTTTSANASGEESPRSIKDILTQLGTRVREIDLVIDEGELPRRAPSTVAAVRENDVVILREGAIAAGDIFDVLGKLSRERIGL